jgi:hypothetical protein
MPEPQNALPDPGRGKDLGKRRELDYLWAQMDNEFNTFRTHYQDLADNILPRRLRFDLSESGRGDKKNNKIIDSTATMAVRTLSAGMMGGVTSPARKWFMLGTPNKEIKENAEVKKWLHDVTEQMNSIFLRSNLYKVFPIMYKDLGTFGTHAMAIEEDFDQTIRFYPFPVGSYRIGVDDRLQVNIFMREFRYTVKQAVEKFGKLDKNGDMIWDNFSLDVREAYEEGRLMAPVDIRHCIRPNPKYNPKKRRMAKHKKYSSDYYEVGHGGTSVEIQEPLNGIFLRESGYDYFPILSPRWETVGEDAYATDCPGITALGDVKEAHLLRKRRSQAIEYVIRPPMKGSTALKEASASVIPGHITYIDDENTGGKGFSPVYQINPDINAISNEIAEVQRKISRTFYEDLFLMLAQSDRREITAREIDERKEEKLLALGPVLEQLNQDVLDPLISITFDIMLEQGLIPDPPEALANSELKVEYISMMHQAQKLVGLAGRERFINGLAQAQALKPDVIDKFNADNWVDDYSEILTIPPESIRTDEEAQAIREERARAQQQREQMEAIEKGAGAAKDLAGADTGGDNALTRLLGQ